MIHKNNEWISKIKTVYNMTLGEAIRLRHSDGRYVWIELAGNVLDGNEEEK
jgi:hypothetical protein